MVFKIKKEIDLKELEKYGYVELPSSYRKRVGYFDVGNLFGFYETIEIKKCDRSIQSILYNDLSDMYWYSNDLVIGHYLQDLFDDNLLDGFGDE